MVDSSSDESTGPKTFIYEDQVEAINTAFEADRQVKVGKGLTDLRESIKAGLTTRKDGTKVGENDADWTELKTGDMGSFEIWAYDKKDIFWDVMEEMQSMEEFSHQALIDAEVKLFYKFEEGGHFKSIMDIKFPNDLVTCSTLFYELDLITKWLEDESMKDIKIDILGKPKRSLSAISLGFPIKGAGNKFMKSRSVTYLDRSTNGILNISGSFPEGCKEWLGIKLPEKPEGYDEMNVDVSFKYLERVDDNTTRHIVFNEMNLGKDVTKDVLVNYILKERTVKACAKMRANYEKIIPHYIERVTGEKKEFYDQIRTDFSED